MARLRRSNRCAFSASRNARSRSLPSTVHGQLVALPAAAFCDRAAPRARRVRLPRAQRRPRGRDGPSSRTCARAACMSSSSGQSRTHVQVGNRQLKFTALAGSIPLPNRLCARVTSALSPSRRHDAAQFGERHDATKLITRPLFTFTAATHSCPRQNGRAARRNFSSACASAPRCATTARNRGARGRRILHVAIPTDCPRR